MIAASLRLWRFGHRPPADLAPPKRPIAVELLRLETHQGQQLLFRSAARAAFLPLVSVFETQRNQTYCGVASIVMVLNALELPAPPAAEYGACRIFTQRNVLNGRTDVVVSERRIARRGMLLAEIAKVLEAYGAKVDLCQAASSTLGAFRELAARSLSTPGHHVIVNYGRSSLGQEGSGHTSPVGAYDADADRFLILDVARYRSPAIWITSDHLFAAMAAPKSPGSSQSRGFLLIRKRIESDGQQGQPPALR
jgi:hypothetical protein